MMTNITIRNLDDRLKRRLCLQAAEHGRALFAPLGGIDLALPERRPPREPPRFD